MSEVSTITRHILTVRLCFIYVKRKMVHIMFYQ